MRQPSAQDPSPEDHSTYVFRIILAFREALQALAAMERTATFTLQLETGEFPEERQGPARRSRPERQAPRLKE